MKVIFTAEELLRVAAVFKRLPVTPSPDERFLCVMIQATHKKIRLSFCRAFFQVDFFLMGHCAEEGVCMFAAVEMKKLVSFFQKEKSITLNLVGDCITIRGESGKALVITQQEVEPWNDWEPGQPLFELGTQDVKFISNLRSDHFTNRHFYLSDGMVIAKDNVHVTSRVLDGVKRTAEHFCYKLPEEAARIFYAAELLPSVLCVSVAKENASALIVSCDKMQMTFSARIAEPLKDVIIEVPEKTIQINKKELLSLLKGLSVGKNEYYGEMQTRENFLSLTYFGEGLYQTQSIKLQKAGPAINFAFDIRFLKKSLSLLPNGCIHLQQNGHILSLISEDQHVLYRFAAVKKLDYQLMTSVIYEAIEKKIKT